MACSILPDILQHEVYTESRDLPANDGVFDRVAQCMPEMQGPCDIGGWEAEDESSRGFFAVILQTDVTAVFILRNFTIYSSKELTMLLIIHKHKLSCTLRFLPLF